MADGGVAVPQFVPVSEGQSNLPMTTVPMQGAPASVGLGPLQGFYQSENQNNDQAMINRKLLSSDLQNQINQVAANVAQANQAPLEQQAGNVNAMLQGEAPFMPSVGVSAAQGDIAKSQKGVLDYQLARSQGQLSAMSQISQMLSDQPLDPNNPADMLRANQASQMAKGMYLDIDPNEMFDPGFAKKLSSATTVLKNSIAHQQELETGAQRVEGEKAKAEITGQYGMNKTGLEADYKQKIADIQSKTKLSVAASFSQMSKDSNVAFSAAVRSIEARGGLTPADIPLLMATATAVIRAQKGSEITDVMSALASDPAKQNDARQQYEQQINNEATSLLKSTFNNWDAVAGQAKANSFNPQPTQQQRTIGTSPQGVGSVYKSPTDGKVRIITGIKDGKLVGHVASDAEQQAWLNGH